MGGQQHVFTSEVRDVRYKAPEVLLGSSPSTASDIYALGLIGAELVSGRRPFDSLRPAQMAEAIACGTTPSIEDHGGVSGAVAKFWPTLEQMWDKDIAMRLTAEGAQDLLRAVVVRPDS